MSKARLCKWVGLVLSTCVLPVTVGSCDLQSIIDQILGGLTGA